MKLIIDIDNDYFEIIKYRVENGDDYKPYTLIAQGIPYEEKPQGDLISREALKKAIMNDLGLGDEENGSDAEYMAGLQDCYNLIDNAPTVKPCENCDLYFKAMTTKEMRKGGTEE